MTSTEDEDGEKTAALPLQDRNKVDINVNWPVWLYIPNIIGYVRIILCMYAFENHVSSEKFFLYYMTSFLLDGADGLAARLLNQTSKAGGLLDMLTDRCATASLLLLLYHILEIHHIHSRYLCIMFIFLDGYSHWIQMVASEVAGSQSHKSASKNPLLTLYYWRPVLTLVCLFNELSLLTFYLSLKQWTGPLIPFSSQLHLVQFCLYLTTPIFALKQLISILQIFSAHQTIVASFQSS